MSSRIPRQASLLALALALASCSGSSSGSQGGSSAADGGSAGGGSAPVTIDLIANTGPLYPCAGPKCDATLAAAFVVTVTNTGPELQGLRLALSLPQDLMSDITAPTIEGGVASGPTGELVRQIDWLPTGASVQANVTLGVRSNFPATTPGTRGGLVTVTTQATLTQDDVVLARSTPASVSGYIPELVTPGMFDPYSGWTDGTWIYLSACALDGANKNQGGVYRIATADGTVAQLATHPVTPTDKLPFLVDGTTLYYVTHAADTNTVLMSVASDGTGPRTQVPLPTGTQNIRALASDATSLFMILQGADSNELVYRVGKGDLGGASVSSPSMVRLQRNTLAVMTDKLAVMRMDKMAVWLLDKATLTPTKLADVASITDERTLACDDARCFWSDQSGAVLFEGALDGSAPLKRGTSYARILFDGSFVYAGTPSLVRVGPGGIPPYQGLSNSNVAMQAFDDTYVYFTVSQNLWRLHK